MNTASIRIDQSVKPLTQNRNMKHVTLTINHSAPVTFPNLPVRNFLQPRRSQVEELKSTLVKNLSAEYSCVAEPLVYQAVNEADALASLTPVPLLFLPALAEEKVQLAGGCIEESHLSRHGNSLAIAA